MDAQAKRDRLLSLDVLRGVAVMGMILVNSAAGMFYDVRATVYSPLLHAHWNGLMLADLVFPAFLMMMGVSIPMALARAKAEPAPRPGVERRILMRAARLVLIGFLLSNIYWFAHFSSGHWRLWGVLQRIGLVYGACALLYLHCGPRLRIWIIVAVLVLYWPLVLAPSLDGLPTDIMARGHNFVASVDRVLLGAGGHNYAQGDAGYDPEGLLGTLPAIAHGLIGVWAGELLTRQPAGRGFRTLGIAGVAMLAVGLAWSLAFPIIKDIWSSSFVLVTCGITLIALAMLHLLIDGKPPGRMRWPVNVPLAFGINAIAAYCLHMVTGSVLGWDLLQAPYRLALSVLPMPAASLIPIFLYMAQIWVAMAWLRAQNWIIKV